MLQLELAWRLPESCGMFDHWAFLVCSLIACSENNIAVGERMNTLVDTLRDSSRSSRILVVSKGFW